MNVKPANRFKLQPHETSVIKKNNDRVGFFEWVAKDKYYTNITKPKTNNIPTIFNQRDQVVAKMCDSLCIADCGPRCTCQAGPLCGQNT
jgi:hypothetical protein